MNPGSAATPSDANRTSRPTLGLTGLTINAMALIAPGAFLWLNFQMQSLYGAPMAGSAMWFGILAALLLCFAISIDDFVVTYFNSGSSVTFPLFVWGAARVGAPPQVNVIGTAIFLTAVTAALFNVIYQRRKEVRA